MRELALSAMGVVCFCAGSACGQVTLPFPAQYELSTLLPANGGTGENGLAINGINEGDFSGHAVAAAGDVNGDGVEDLIIGAVLVGNAQSLYVGESYVVFGGAHLGSAGNLELASLDGTNGFRIEATIPHGASGSAVASAGDVNNDGYDDVIVASSIPSNFSFGSGDCHVIFGGANIGASGTLPLASIDGTNGFAIDASDMLNFGGRPAAAGDLNDDGIDDFIIGVPHADPNGDRSGIAYVVFGKQGLGAGGTLDLAMLDGADGFAINGKDPVDNFGTALAPAGDFNMDGIDDIIIGAFGGDPNSLSSGESYIIFGAHNIGASGSIEVSALDGGNGFVLNGIDQLDKSGATVATAGDVNGDNADDIIIGAYQADPNGDDSGETYVVFGGMNVGNSGSLELSTLDGTNGFVLYGENPTDESGLSVSPAGDLNNSITQKHKCRSNIKKKRT